VRSRAGRDSEALAGKPPNAMTRRSPLAGKARGHQLRWSGLEEKVLERWWAEDTTLCLSPGVLVPAEPLTYPLRTLEGTAGSAPRSSQLRLARDRRRAGFAGMPPSGSVRLAL